MFDFLSVCWSRLAGVCLSGPREASRFSLQLPSGSRLDDAPTSVDSFPFSTTKSRTAAPRTVRIVTSQRRAGA
jgi:hypothetical protein